MQFALRLPSSDEHRIIQFRPLLAEGFSNLTCKGSVFSPEYQRSNSDVVKMNGEEENGVIDLDT
jgi:hypothetical protein